MPVHARSGRAALALGLLVAGLSVAVALAMVLRSDPGHRDRTAEDAGDPALLAELRAQRELQQRTLEAIERLGERLASAPAADGTRRAADELPAPQVEELLRGLDALRESFEAQTTRTLDTIAAAPIFQEEPLSRVRERRRDVDWPALEALRAEYEADPRAADTSQYFLSARELLEVYGPPSDIFRPSKGGLLFHYRRAPRDVEAPAWYFRVQDGFVVEFFVEVNREAGD